MKFSKKISTRHHKNVEYVIEGNGAIFFLFIGPWEIYAHSFSAHFKQLATIVACDYWWIEGSHTATDQAVYALSLQELLAFYKDIAETFRSKKFILIGPSAIGFAATEFAYLYPHLSLGVLRIGSPLTMLGLSEQQEKFINANYNSEFLPESFTTKESLDKWRSHQEAKHYYQQQEKQGFLSSTAAYIAELKRDELKYYQNPDLAIPFYEHWKKLKISIRNHFFGTLLNQMHFERHREVRCPVFDALGLTDGIAPFNSITDSFSQLPCDHEYYIFQAAHMPQYEAQKEFDREIECWLKKILSKKEKWLSHL